MASQEPKYVTFRLSDVEEVTEKKGFFNRVLSKFKVDSVTQVKKYETNRDDAEKKQSEMRTGQQMQEADSCCNFPEGSEEQNENPVNSSASGLSAQYNRTEPDISWLQLPLQNNNICCSEGSKLPSDRRYWMLDQSCPHCYECGSRFTAIRRKHHCRVCGRIFCHQCSNQFLEGNLIGLSGPQRACNYCALTLQAQSVPNNLCRSVETPTPHTSATNQPDDSSSVKQDSIESVSDGTGVKAPDFTSRSSTDLWSRISQTATISSVSGAKHLLSAVNLGRPNKTASAADEQRSAHPGTAEPPPSNVFPGFAISASPVTHRKRPTPPAPNVALRSSWCLNSPPFSSTASAKFSGSLQPGLMVPKTDLDDEPTDASMMCNPNKRCNVAGHACTDLTDQQILALWQRTVERRLCSATDEDMLLETENQSSSGAVALSNIHPNSKELQVIVVMHNGRKLCCASGISLVYWFVTNVDEVDHCRWRARSVCQRFMDLSLLLDLNSPSRTTFCDDFTPYELRSVHTPLASSPHTLDRRVSWPSASLQKVHQLSAANHLDEPDWLREIEDSSTRVSFDLSSSPAPDCPTVSDDEVITGHPSSSSTVRKSALRETANLSASVDLGVKILFPRDRSTKSLLQTFEVGVDVRPHSESFETSPTIHHRQACGGSAVDVGNPPMVRVRRVPTASESQPKPTSSKYPELTEPLRSAYDDHLLRLVRQDVRDNHLDDKWTKPVLSLARAVCQLVSFDLRSSGLRVPPVAPSDREAADTSTEPDNLTAKRRRPPYSSMDIRHYVHVKKLLDDTGAESEIFAGTVFTKRSAHRFMSTVLHNPRILLLASSIDYQRTLTKMTWLESQIMQEEEYLSNCVSKLLCLRPKVIFVGGGVSHAAQMFLLKAGVTLFCNVKQSVLQRIARITGADILESVDRLVGDNASKSNNPRPTTQLGICQQFQVKPVSLPNGGVKFLTLIKKSQQEASPSNTSTAELRALASRHTTIESTVLLRGPDLSELKRAKRCLLHAIYLFYNTKLELSYTYNGSIYWPASQALMVRTKTGLKGNTCLVHSEKSSGSLTSGTAEDSAKRSSYNKMVESNASGLDLTDLADQLNDRAFSPSPSVHVRLPFLASDEGRSVPLSAYYTYVIEWPFGRKLNDLLKRKLKVMHAELYAMTQERKLSSRVALMERNMRANQLCDHPFLTCNLVVNSSSPSELPNLLQSRRTTTALSGLGNATDQLIALALDNEDEARYVDFKARAFTPASGSDTANAQFPFLSRMWAGKGSLLSGCWDRFLEARENPAGSRAPAASMSNLPNQLLNWTNEIQQVRRLERSILDPRSHQFFSFLTTLFTSKSFMWPEPCVPPWIATVEFYGLQDLPLGLFLEKCCFTPQHCRHPHCEVPMIEHVQRFAQTAGSVQLAIRKLNQDPPRPSASGVADSTSPSVIEATKLRPDSRIQMWLLCPLCRTSTQTVYMSGDTWHYSFVKFLDLLINSPSDWGRCASRAPVVSVADPSTTTTTGKGDGTTKDTTTTVTAVQRLEPTLQLTCAHSAYKAVQHCFAFDRILAVFKFQPVTVYEVVMPPNEIRIYPPGMCPSNCTAGVVCASDTESRKHHRVLPAALSDSSSRPSDEPKRISPSSQQPETGATTASLPLSGYLYSEALDTLDKYYQVHQAVKLHLLTLQQENASSELLPTIKTLIYLFESDTRKAYMDVRADLLTFLFHPEGIPRPTSSNTVDTMERSVPRAQSVASFSSIPMDPAKDQIASDKDVVELPSVTPLFSLTSDTKHGNDRSAMIQDPIGIDVGAVFQTPLLRVKETPAPDSLSSAQSSSGINPEDWLTSLNTLDGVEKMHMAQTLINELKRWIYGFITDWNNRCAEFDTVAKRAEKSTKDSRKKPSSAGGTVFVSPGTQMTKQQKTTTSESNVSTVDSAGSHHRTASQVSTMSIYTNPMASLIEMGSMEPAGLPKSTHSSARLFDEDGCKELGAPTTATNAKDSDNSLFASPRGLDSASSPVMCPPSTILRVRHFTSKVEVMDAQNNRQASPPLDAATMAVSPGARDASTAVVSSSEERPSVRLVKAESSNDKKQKLPVLDPLHLKVIYQTSETEAVPTGGHSPLNNRKFLFQMPESTVQAAASAASISLSAPSGMRRFIHTLLPSSGGLKPFDEPFPPHEHPQLSLAEEFCSAPFKRSQTASLNMYQAEASGVSARSAEYTQNLIQHLRFSAPDVYVNDRELTSIIAYALSTYEYERHLVDLHSLLNTHSSVNSSLQIGQYASSDLGFAPKDSTDQPSPLSSVTTLRNQKPHQSNSESDLTPGNSARSSVLSSRSGDHPLLDTVSTKSATSSSSNVTHSNRTLKSSSFAVSSSSSARNLPVSAQVISTGTAPTQSGTERTGTTNNRHIKIQFSDSTTQFFCCVYYASEFFRLRQLLLPQGDVGFIRSLARCYQWDARGGKSGSLFMKTCDERFVVKELSSIEMKTFHEISHQYFDYLIGAALEQRLCVLSRILGVFHVGFKNSVSGEAHRFDVLVMENLFHDRPKLCFIYDLKGSLRKRLADEQGTFNRTSSEVGDNRDAPGSNVPLVEEDSSASGPNGKSTGVSRPDELGNEAVTNGQPSKQKHVPVLLDQNLLNASVDSPLYLRVHSKNALSHCLQVDTAFLTNLFIMDYSLLVGVDPSTNQLVIGLIDYLRKFTLDKRLEMLIKQTITSAQGPMPTILTPDLYRERFLFQMDSYFPLVPDQWYDSLAEHAEAWRVNPVRHQKAVPVPANPPTNSNVPAQ